MTMPWHSLLTPLVVFVIGAILGCPAVRAADEAAPEPLTDAEARAIVKSVLPLVEEIRGLSFRQPVDVAVVDDDRAREHMLRRFETFQDVEDLALEGRALGMLGVLPEGVDILQVSLEFLREQAGGFYDPETKNFFLLGDMPRAMAPMLVSHELTHALEDQHFDIDKRLRAAMPDDDRLFARSAIHEGSATLLMTAYMFRAMADGTLSASDLMEIAESEAVRGDKLGEIPEALLRPLLGAYLLGATFLAEGNISLVATEGYPVKRVDEACAQGPVSSEQILHPEKYWDPDQRDDPVSVELAGAGELLGKRWKKRADGVLGELMLGTMVGAPTPRQVNDPMAMYGDSWTNKAAKGWDGDRWELWMRGDAAVVLLGTVWDSARDAKQFADGLEARSDLTSKTCGARVAVLAGSAGAKTGRVLARMLQDADCGDP